MQVGSHRTLRRGKLRIEAPKGTSLVFESTSADLEVKGTAGDVRVQTMSGDVKISGVRLAPEQESSAAAERELTCAKMTG